MAVGRLPPARPGADARAASRSFPIASPSCAPSRWSPWCRCCARAPSPAGSTSRPRGRVQRLRARRSWTARARLYRFRRTLVILAVQASDLAPRPSRRARGLPRVGRAFRARSDAALVIHDLERAGGAPSAGARSTRSCGGWPRAHAGVYVLPYADLVGPPRRPRTWARRPQPGRACACRIANERLVPLVRRWLRFIHPAQRADLQGAGHRPRQHAVGRRPRRGRPGRDRVRRGGRARATRPAAGTARAARARHPARGRAARTTRRTRSTALERHPGMLLRPAHFAALRINWRDKPANLREIAAELNIGTDALAFLDDNPVERERVRARAAGGDRHRARRTPRDGAGGACATTRCSRASRSRRRTARASGTTPSSGRAGRRCGAAPSLEDFYHSLAQEVVDRADDARDGRARRPAHAEDEPVQPHHAALHRGRAAAPGRERRGRTCSRRGCSDCYGDNGLTGLAIVRRRRGASEIDTFLLSCRVLGRGVEAALLAFLADRARALGRQRGPRPLHPHAQERAGRGLLRAATASSRRRRRPRAACGWPIPRASRSPARPGSASRWPRE